MSEVAAFNQGHGWFFWNFRTEFEPHWDFLEAYRRGWFPRNVSDVAALDALKICDPSTPPLTSPTVPPPVLDDAKAWLLAWWRDAALTATRHAEDAWTRAWKRAWPECGRGRGLGEDRAVSTPKVVLRNCVSFFWFF